MRTAAVPTLALLATLTACASSPARQSADDCAVPVTDSSSVAGGAVYPECAVDTPAESVSARLVFDPSSRVAATPRPGVTCYAAEVEFVVGADGHPEEGTVRLLRTDDHAFGQALLRSVPGWTYSPAVLDGRPVRQLVRERRATAIAVTVTVTSSTGGPPPSPRPPRPPRCR